MQVILRANTNWKSINQRQGYSMCTIVHASTCCWETYCPRDNHCPTQCQTST